MMSNIDDVIKKIDTLFRNFNKEADKFTVDYDEKGDGLYCHYTPYVNDIGYTVSKVLIHVSDTSMNDLQKIKDYLIQNKIESRNGCEWYVEWGWKSD